MFLLITNLTHFFIYLFVSSLYMLRASQCSSSGDRIVLIHHLVWLICISDCLVCLTGIPSSHLHRLIIPDDVLIQCDLLMMSTWCSKHVERWNKYMKKCIRLDINKNWRDARSTKYKMQRNVSIAYTLMCPKFILILRFPPRKFVRISQFSHTDCESSQSQFLWIYLNDCMVTTLCYRSKLVIVKQLCVTVYLNHCQYFILYLLIFCTLLSQWPPDLYLLRNWHLQDQSFSSLFFPPL